MSTPRCIVSSFLKTKDKVKNHDSHQREASYLKKKKNNSNDIRFLITYHGGQEKLSQYYSGAKRRENHFIILYKVKRSILNKGIISQMKEN